MMHLIQANPVQSNHPLVMVDDFVTLEEYALHLIHCKAYEHASALCEGRSVLDWGCNNGYGLPLLAITALQVGSLDTNVKCVEEARRRYPAYANDIWLYNGRDIPFPTRDWDVIVSFQVIEHVRNMSAYLQAIKSVLSDAGVVLFTTPNREIRLDPEMKPWNEFTSPNFPRTI
jgi:2-polyprenyl-3-methyl-5-hydroxy-6-metoxy-1,4-benzoquinol methylase